MNTMPPGMEDAWESRSLGAEEAFVEVLDDQQGEGAAIDDALEMKPISIRLHKSLIDDFKLIADINGLGYQTLMRQVLKRFADCEMKRILREITSESVALRRDTENETTESANEKDRRAA